MKKILILGASILQLPAIIKAKERGFYVGVADYNPKAVGIEYADEFFNTSTIDIDAVTAVAKRFRPDGIMTLATDMPMRSVAAAAAALGLPGISPETAIRATDKGEMIKAFKKHKVESPWYTIINHPDELGTIGEQLTFPCIMKPTDNAGSRGVILINNPEELLEAYRYSSAQSRSGTVIAEEYMRGDEVSVEIMVVEGTVTVLAVTDKRTTGAPHFVEMGHSQPSILKAEAVESIKDLAVRAVKAIGIDCGPAHVEIMLTADGPKMIELGARMGGDCITTHLVPLSTGIDMVAATIELLTGGQPDIEPRWSRGSAIRYLTVPRGRIKNIEGIDIAESVDGVKDIVILKKAGEETASIDNSADRVGYVIATGKNANEAVERCNEAMGLVRITLR